jgi:peptide/nickel transport system permease protein
MQELVLPEPSGARPRRRRSGLWGEALARLLRNRAAAASAIYLIALITLALLAPMLMPYDPLAADFTAIRQPPSAKHWFGTDEIGRDVLTRVVHGARISLFVALTVQFLGSVTGVALGLIAGYYGGLADLIIMRLVDIMYAIPPFLFAVFMVSLLRPTMWSVIVTLALVSWPLPARLMRAQVLTLRAQDAVMAARALGARDLRILLAHITPNALTPVIVQFTLGMATVIMAEAGLSFLGIGIRPPNPTWGGMISNAREYIRTDIHMTVFPAVVLGLTMIAINYLGDGLRDALDPKMKR